MRLTIARFTLISSIILSAWFYAFYGKESYPFYGDSMGYYMYLPSTFIYHNHKALDWLPKDRNIPNVVFSIVDAFRSEGTRTPKGYLINKYTYGVAAMELPFFFVAHGYEKLSGGYANGYSMSYRRAIQVSAMVYTMLALLLLYRTLRSFFDEVTSLITVAIILAGTNLFWFTLYQAGMAHAPVFFLYTLLFYATIRLSKKPQLIWFILGGLAAGTITIIRPTDIICLLIPLLYNVYDRKTWNDKIIFIRSNGAKMAAFSVSFMVPVIPQLLYWKKFAGSFFYYSYQGEGFDWSHPHIIDGIFSFMNGWLIYTPVMVLALAGLLLYKQFKPVALLIFIMFPAYLYIIYSWHCYSYINGLGSRPMIHLYPLLAIPLAALLQYIGQRKAIVKYAVVLIAILFSAVNISYSIQQASGILFSEESNAVYNMHMLFRVHANYNDLVTYDIKEVQPDEGSLVKVGTLACNYFDDSVSDHYIHNYATGQGYIYHVQDSEEYYPGKVEVRYDSALFKHARWIKCSGRFFCPKPYLYFKHLFTLDIAHDGNTSHWFGCKIDNKLGLEGDTAAAYEYTFGHVMLNKWAGVHFFIRVPGDIHQGDRIRLDIWNLGKREMYVDDVCLELYK